MKDFFTTVVVVIVGYLISEYRDVSILFDVPMSVQVHYVTDFDASFSTLSFLSTHSLSTQLLLSANCPDSTGVDLVGFVGLRK
jgi:hypothetical protein